MTFNFLTELYNDLMQIIRGLCVKRYDLALEAETLETSRAFDIYLSCVNGTSYFLTFPSYDVQALLDAGYDQETAELYAADPWDNVPEEEQAKVAKAETNYYLKTYEEKNNYYRTIMGLPPVGTPPTAYIYPTDEDGNYLYYKEDAVDYWGAAIVELEDHTKGQWGTADDPTDPRGVIDLTGVYDYEVVTNPDTEHQTLETYDTVTVKMRVRNRMKPLTDDQYYIDAKYTIIDGKIIPTTNADGQKIVYLVVLDDVFITENQLVQTTVTHTDEPVPIHELTTDQIGRLSTYGVLDEIKAAHPDDEYLNYLGVNAIDHLQARLAKPFDLLRIGDPSNPRVIELFQREYYYARRYVTANYYNRQQVSAKTLYDPTIGVIIVTLAVRNTFALDEKSYMDFDEILNNILESYGMLKYFKKYPFIYKKRLVLALDALLERKGTDGVLVDVCKVFSPTQDLIADRYYLMKTQKRDPTGAMIESDDPDDMYSITFLRARIEDRDIHTSEEYRVDYDAVTENDYLWQIQKYGPDGVTITDEYRRLLEEPYNLRMVKYVDAQAAYDISSLVFEICCFTNMLLESRDFLSKLILSNQYATGANISIKNKYAPDGSSQLFTMLIFMLATLAQRAGYDGNIVYDPDTIAETWGTVSEGCEIWHFNYQDLTRELQKVIDEYELDVDINDVMYYARSKEIYDLDVYAEHIDELGLPTLLPSYAPPTIPDDNFTLEKPSGSPTASSLVQNYVSNRMLFDAIQETMNTTQSMDQYQGLKIIRDILFTRYSEEAAFEKSDGTLAKTYRELLDDLDPRLGKKLDSIADDEDALNGVAVYILEQLQDYFRSDDLHYLFLNTPEVYISLIRDYIEIAINMFKASSVQLRNINVIFMYGDNDPIRFFDDKFTHYKLYLNDEVHIQDEMSLNYKLVLEDYIAVGDKIYLE